LDGSRLLARLCSQLLKLLGVLGDPAVALSAHLLELKLQFLLPGPTYDQLSSAVASFSLVAVLSVSRSWY
jgi:hypothetical protein